MKQVHMADVACRLFHEY